MLHRKATIHIIYQIKEGDSKRIPVRLLLSFVVPLVRFYYFLHLKPVLNIVPCLEIQLDETPSSPL